MGKNSHCFDAVILRAGTEEPYPKFTSVETYKTGINDETRKKDYIIVQKDDEFEIKLKAPDSSKVYGVKLYIDGQYIHYKKTFLRRGYMRGYKLGAGLFRTFRFQVPEVAETEEQRKELGAKPSTIRIEFYETAVRYIPNLNGVKRTDKDVYKPARQLDDKKRYVRSLTVKYGGLKQFNVDKHKVNDFLFDVSKGMYKDHVIDTDHMLDALELGYADFFTLQMRGLISFSNPDHLKFIPQSSVKLENRGLLKTIIETLITSSEEGIGFEELEKLFGKKVMIPWRQLSKSSIQSFVELELSGQVALVDGKLRMEQEESKGKNMRKDLDNRRLESGLIPKFYYEVPKDRKISSRSLLLRRYFSKEFSGQSPLVQSDKANGIDLELTAQMRGKPFIIIDDDEEAPIVEEPTNSNQNAAMEIEAVLNTTIEPEANPGASQLEDPFAFEDENSSHGHEEGTLHSIEENLFDDEEINL